MKFLFFLTTLNILLPHTANAVIGYNQCALDERPFLLSYEFSNDKAKSLFQIQDRKDKKSYPYRMDVGIKSNVDIGLLTDMASSHRAFVYNGKTEHVSYEKRLRSKETCYAQYKPADEISKEEKDSTRYSDLSFSCYSQDDLDNFFFILENKFFYTKGDIKKIRKNIANSAEDFVKLKKTHKFKYFFEGDVHEAEISATAKLNPNQFKVYQCNEGSEILICGENCLKYTKKIDPNDFYKIISDSKRINLKDTKSQYLIEFEFSAYSKITPDHYVEEEVVKKLNEALKESEGKLDLKELTLISRTIISNKPIKIISLRASKYE